MLHAETSFSWSETPRMRWRAYGVLPYLGELAVASGVLGGFALIVVLLASQSWESVLWAAAIGATGGLAIQLLPKSVALRNGTFSYGNFKSYDFQFWPIDHCRLIRITTVRGVLRIEVEVPMNYNPIHEDRPCRKTTFVVLARPKHAESILRAFEAGGATMSSGMTKSAGK